MRRVSPMRHPPCKHNVAEWSRPPSLPYKNKSGLTSRHTAGLAALPGTDTPTVPTGTVHYARHKYSSSLRTPSLREGD